MRGAVVGRDEELRTLARFVERVGEGGPVFCLVEGKAGAGKTTLLLEAVQIARERGLRVLSARPVEAETRLSFAGLGDLLEPVVDDVIGELPAVQRGALEAALLLAEVERPAPDHRAVAVAARGALRLLAHAGPLLVAVDDVQWLDSASTGVLAFAARRLSDDPIGLLLAHRVEAGKLLPPGFERSLPDDRLVRVEVGPLSFGALGALLRARAPLPLPRPLLRRIHETSGGNPFFALELARALARRGQLPQADEPLPVPADVHALLRERVSALPPLTLEVLRCAALAAQPTVGLLERTLGADATAALGVALDERVLELDRESLRFTHPLLASAIAAELSAGDWRRLHRRLAGAVADVEQCARHLALASERPDAEVAATLEEAARAARSRGAPTSAAELAEAAVRCTPQERADELYRRTLAAADYHDVAGQADQARDLLEELVAREPRGHTRAVALERLARVVGDAAKATRLFEQAREEAGDDLALKITIEQGLAGADWVAWRDVPGAARHLREALHLAEDLGDERTLVRVLGAVVWVESFLGCWIEHELLERALALRESVRDLPLAEDPRWTQANVLAWTDKLARSRSLLEALAHDAVARDEEGALAMFLHMLSKVEWRLGQWADAKRHAAEAEELARSLELDTIRAFALEKQVWIDAHMGYADTARAKAAEGLAVADASGAVWTETSIRHSLGMLALSRGDPAEAQRELDSVADRMWAAGIREPANMRETPDEVEALVALGETARAADLLERFEREARRLDRAWALATAARCRALLAAADGDFARAEQTFGEALRQHKRLQEPFELGRTLLARGTFERRAKQRRAARETLLEARAIFERLGARLWAERASEELGRIGGRAPAAGALTPTEERVAELVAQGRTNREVAAALFVAHRTVEGHLSRIYAKLGVRSRAELVRRYS